MNITPHFTVGEFTANSRGLKFDPTPAQLINITALCMNILEPIRNHYNKPVFINSGLRNPELNALDGGQPDSQHLLGQAADIRVPGIRNDLLFIFIKKALPFDQLIAEQLNIRDGAAGWIHVSYCDKPRRNAISFLGNGKYVAGLEYAFT